MDVYISQIVFPSLARPMKSHTFPNRISFSKKIRHRLQLGHGVMASPKVPRCGFGFVYAWRSRTHAKIRLWHQTTHEENFSPESSTGITVFVYLLTLSKWCCWMTWGCKTTAGDITLGTLLWNLSSIIFMYKCSDNNTCDNTCKGHIYNGIAWTRVSVTNLAKLTPLSHTSPLMIYCNKEQPLIRCTSEY